MLTLFGAVIGTVVEELYFRGHLLPRMSYAGKWARNQFNCIVLKFCIIILPGFDLLRFHTTLPYKI